jgi:hypothetical protein
LPPSRSIGKIIKGFSTISLWGRAVTNGD